MYGERNGFFESNERVGNHVNGIVVLSRSFRCLKFQIIDYQRSFLELYIKKLSTILLQFEQQEPAKLTIF